MIGQLVRGLLLTLAVLAILTGLAGLRSFEGTMGLFIIAMGATAVYWLNRWSKAAIAATAAKDAASKSEPVGRPGHPDAVRSRDGEVQ
jgi:predicted lipid-binding transport protein (Tim44 family)